MWADDPASRALGMALLELGPGHAVVAMTVRPDMVNGYAVCHGGLVASLADSAFALACNSRGVPTVAAGFDVTFLEPAARGRRARGHRRGARPARPLRPLRRHRPPRRRPWSPSSAAGAARCVVRDDRLVDRRLTQPDVTD